MSIDYFLLNSLRDVLSVVLAGGLCLSLVRISQRSRSKIGARKPLGNVRACHDR
jgi:hypothetical protein